MCRYQWYPTKTHWVCLPCRNIAKSMVQRTCPTCREPMVDFGHDFKAPRKEATNQWRKLQLMVDTGRHLFGSCGCTGPGHTSGSVRTLADVKQEALKRQRWKEWRSTVL